MHKLFLYMAVMNPDRRPDCAHVARDCVGGQDLANGAESACRQVVFSCHEKALAEAGGLKSFSLKNC